MAIEWSLEYIKVLSAEQIGIAVFIASSWTPAVERVKDVLPLSIGKMLNLIAGFPRIGAKRELKKALERYVYVHYWIEQSEPQIK